MVEVSPFRMITHSVLPAEAACPEPVHADPARFTVVDRGHAAIFDRQQDLAPLAFLVLARKVPLRADLPVESRPRRIHTLQPQMKTDSSGATEFTSRGARNAKRDRSGGVLMAVIRGAWSPRRRTVSPPPPPLIADRPPAVRAFVRSTASCAPTSFQKTTCGPGVRPGLSQGDRDQPVRRRTRPMPLDGDGVWPSPGLVDTGPDFLDRPAMLCGAHETPSDLSARYASPILRHRGGRGSRRRRGTGGW